MLIKYFHGLKASYPEDVASLFTGKTGKDDDGPICVGK